MAEVADLVLLLGVGVAGFTFHTEDKVKLSQTAGALIAAVFIVLLFTSDPIMARSVIGAAMAAALGVLLAEVLVVSRAKKKSGL